MTEDEARLIGRSFRSKVLGNKEIATGVDAFRLANPSLSNLFVDFDFFAPLLISIGRKLIVSSNMGLIKRVTLGAALSISDMVSDLFVTVSYYKEGNTTAATALLSMIGVSQIFQMVIVWGSNHKKSKLVQIREVLIVFSVLKPGVDAYRVAMGEIDELSTFTPLLEMVMGKGSELACER